MPDRTQLIKRSAAEFLIIVTGILAAFYVDEFRDSRRSQALEREYLERLAADLDDALGNLTTGVAYARRRAAEGRAVLAHLSGERAMEPIPLMVAALEVTLVPVARERRLGRRTTYDELVTTGNLSTLRESGLRDALARYYEVYARVGGRVEDWPEGWRTWVGRQLSPDLLLAVDRMRGCSSQTGASDSCAVDVPLSDQEQFARQLATEADFARGELNRMVQYQDRQLADLLDFLEATNVMRDRLRRPAVRPAAATDGAPDR